MSISKKRLSAALNKYSIAVFVILLCIAGTYAAKKLGEKDKEKTGPFLNLDYLKSKLAEGAELSKQGNYKQELALYADLLRYEKVFSFVHLNIGKALTKIKNYKEAEIHLKKAIELRPDNKSAYLMLGIILRTNEKAKESLEILQQAHTSQPEKYETNLELSKTYYQLKQYDQALTFGIKAAKIKPSNIYALLNIAYIYNQQGKLDLAIKMYRKILTIAPDLDNANYNLGYSLKIKGEIEEALTYLDKAIALKPDYLDAHIARSQAKIAIENFEEGWEEYEWRWGLFGIKPMEYKNSMWDGSPIKGKTILLKTEQGLGDTLQFIRYAKLVKEMGAHVICKVQKPLVKLVSSCDFIDKVIHELDDSIKYDEHAHLMSLPRILKTKPDTIPADTPYLKADPTLEKAWEKTLEQDKNFKVGLCWHVDPVHEKTKSPWSFRAIAIEQFKSFAQVEGVSFYSLQKLEDDTELKRAPKGLQLKTFGPDFDRKHGSFMDSAAIIKHLDLVITVDTCIAHLAGGLHKPVWMLLPYAPDCRWRLEKTDTPWYPTMTLFRAKTPQVWDDILDTIAVKLANHIKEQKTTIS